MLEQKMQLSIQFGIISAGVYSNNNLIWRKNKMVSKQTRHNWIKRFSLKVKQSAKRYNRAKERSINRNPKQENSYE